MATLTAVLCPILILVNVDIWIFSPHDHATSVPTSGTLSIGLGVFGIVNFLFIVFFFYSGHILGALELGLFSRLKLLTWLLNYGAQLFIQKEGKIDETALTFYIFFPFPSAERKNMHSSKNIKSLKYKWNLSEIPKGVGIWSCTSLTPLEPQRSWGPEDPWDLFVGSRAPGTHSVICNGIVLKKSTY